MLLVLSQADGRLYLHEATLQQQVLARCWADRLDRQLALGASPEADELLALRAQQLVRPASRRALAKSITSMLAELDAGPHLCWDPRVPVRRAEVARAVDLLGDVVQRLMAPALLPAQGIAQIRLLLVDGTGPLYNPGTPLQLRPILAAAIQALEPLDVW